MKAPSQPASALARGTALIGGLLLGACATTFPTERPNVPQPAPSPAQVEAPVTASPPLATERPVEAAYRARAHSLAQSGRLADAAVQWELLTLLRPDVAEYRTQLSATQKLIAEALPERLRAGEQARQRGDLDQATTQYLRALSLDPLNVTAAEALREIERERVRRNYLNRPPRSTMAGMLAPPKPLPKPAANALTDADTGVMLFRQGDYQGAIQSLQRHLQHNRQDEMARGYLADAFFQQGTLYAKEGRREDALFYFERAQASGYRDKAAVQASIRSTRQALGDEYFKLGVQAAANDLKRAVFLWERSLAYDPGNSQAATRLTQAKERSGAQPAAAQSATGAASAAGAAAKPSATAPK